MDLHRVNDACRHGLELIKAAILALKVPDIEKEFSEESWSIPTHVIKSQQCLNALVDGAWATAYNRYLSFHLDLRKSSSRCTRREFRQVSTLLSYTFITA